LTFSLQNLYYRYTGPREGFFDENMKLLNYLKATRGELKHVSWPTQKQTALFTIIVIIISIITAAFLGFFDFLFTTFLDLFIL